MTDVMQAGRTPAKPGGALKALRTKRGWTLSDVSLRTGLPVSSLSKIENDKLALSFEKLVRISDGLGIDITELFGPSAVEAPRQDGAARRSITRAGDGKVIEMGRGNYLYVAAELLNKRMVPIVGEVFAKDIKTYGDFLRHPGEEYVYVIEGILELHTDMYTPARLEAGDSVYFDSSMGHAYIAVGDEPCRILSVCTTSEAQMIGALEEEAVAEKEADIQPLPRVLRRAQS